MSTPNPEDIERAMQEGVSNDTTVPGQNEPSDTVKTGPNVDRLKAAVEAKGKAGISDNQGKYSLDLDERNRPIVRLGGKLWEAVEPTIEVNKKLTEAIPKVEDDEDQGAAANAALSSIYPQVAEVLVSVDDGFPPSREFVEKHLTGRNFGRLMTHLNEEAQAGNG